MKLGFIGTGNMGGALARVVGRAIPDRKEMAVSDKVIERADALAKEIGVETSYNTEIAKNAKFIILGIKPQFMGEVLAEIKDDLLRRSKLEDRFVLVTMAAGMTMEKIQQLAGGDYPVIRIMPNLAATVGKAMIMMAKNEHVTTAETEEFIKYFSAAGIIDQLDERLIDVGMAVSGCGPAYVFMAIEALADGAVKCGLPRDKALLYAKKMIEGSAAYALASDKHPEELKDAVCSPGGTTIEGVLALEQMGYRSALSEAVIAAYEKSVELGK